MGKVRTRVLGLEEVEEKQKKKQKERSVEKKVKEAKTPSEAEKQTKRAASEVIEERVGLAVSKGDEKSSEAKEAGQKDKKKTQKARPPRKRGIRYLGNKRLVEKTKSYNPSEAVALLKKMKAAGFDESVELHL